MNLALTFNSSLQNSLWQPKSLSKLRLVSTIALGNFLLIIASKILLPLQPVPVTLQTLAVLGLGMALGWRLGIMCVAAFLLEGALGLPVFAHSTVTGIAAFMGPTGGYLFSFIPAVIISGALVERGWGRYAMTTLLAGIMGLCVIYTFGVMVLTAYVGWNAALTLGIKPFLLADALKLMFLSFIIPAFWRDAK